MLFRRVDFYTSTPAMAGLCRSLLAVLNDTSDDRRIVKDGPYYLLEKNGAPKGSDLLLPEGHCFQPFGDSNTKRLLVLNEDVS